MKKAQQYIALLNLKKHPEGGYYAQTFKSSTNVIIHTSNISNDAPNPDKIRSASTTIYYLLENQDFSAWHRLKSEETWHFYKGSPLYLYVITPQGELKTHILGDPLEDKGATLQLTVPPNCWFSAELIHKKEDSFVLVGCTVTPGFEFKDFELVNQKALALQYPKHKAIIERLSRDTTPEQTALISELEKKENSETP